MEFDTYIKAAPGASLSGTITVPGDKSLSHRALICGALATGVTSIRGLLESDDVLATLAAMRAFGASVEAAPAPDGRRLWRVQGCGVGGWRAPREVLDFGNSGTGVRLVMGAMATTPITATFTGDDSLRRRPMGRVLTPLEAFGAEVQSAEGARLPVTLTGARAPQAITYSLPVPSAQVKSAILLAALNTPGETVVIEPVPTRDHTERLLAQFGAAIDVTPTAQGRRITLRGAAPLSACELDIPGDPSSAAFPAVAALIVPGSQIVIRNVLVNPLRTGLYTTLAEMGADLTFTRRRLQGGEPVADLVVKGGALRAVNVPAARAPSMIDEYPILAVAAAFARGTTTLAGLAELRVKESDRLAAIEAGLRACGVPVKAGADSLTITGLATAEGPAHVPGGARVHSHHDHRLAMAFAVMGLAAAAPVEVDGAAMIPTSFPGFTELMCTLGADLESREEGRS